MKAPGVEVPFEDRLLGELDPPRHTLVRRVVVTALSPKLVHATEPFIRETADALLAAMSRDGRPRAAVHGAAPEPHDRAHDRPRSRRRRPARRRGRRSLMESTFPAMNRTERGEGFAGAFPEFAGYIDEHIEARAAEIAAGTAPDDVLTRAHADHRRRRATPPPPDPRAGAQPHHRRLHHHEPARRQPAAPDPHRSRGRARDPRRATTRCTAPPRRACASRRRSCSWRAAA